MKYEMIVGLEVHVELKTRTKIFCSCRTDYGAAPNTQVCPICLGMPGTLPVLNRRAVELGVIAGTVTHCDIAMVSRFDRKNYFYPDLPKGYQTTQLASPIVGAGYLDITLGNGDTKRVRIHHAHLEEDAGKSLHEDFHGMSGIDLNRAGTPLIEVVTEPDMRSAEEASTFAKKLHGLVTSLCICDGEMSQGSLRFDVNISIRPKGQEKLGTRTETKNLNSFKFMEEAIELEIERQIHVLESGGEIVQETRLYNGDTKKARSMRTKEDSNDYRYFPCPDLLPVVLDEAYIDDVRRQMPELPEAKRARYVAELGLPEYDAGILSSDAATAHYFEDAARLSGQPKLAANWVMGEIAAQLTRQELSIRQCPISAADLAGLIKRLEDRTISSKMAKTVFEAMWSGEGDADTVIETKGLKQVSDSGAL